MNVGLNYYTGTLTNSIQSVKPVSNRLYSTDFMRYRFPLPHCLWSMLYIWSELRNVVYLLRLEKNTCLETSLDRWQVIYGRQTGWILDLQHSIESAVQHNTWPGVSYRKRCTLSQCLASVSGRIVKIPYCYLSILARLFRLLRRMSLLRYHWLFWCRGVQAVLLLWQFP